MKKIIFSLLFLIPTLVFAQTTTLQNQTPLLKILPSGTGTEGQVLKMSSGNADWAADEGGSGSESETIVLKTSDTDNATTTLADATGLSFSVAANKTYIIEGFIIWNTTATAVGIKISATAPASPAIIAGHFITDAASGAPDSSSFNADNIVVTTSASPFTTGNIGALHCVLVNGSNAGTFQVRFAAETTGTVTIKAGSVLRYRQVN